MKDSLISVIVILSALVIIFIFKACTVNSAQLKYGQYFDNTGTHVTRVSFKGQTLKTWMLTEPNSRPGLNTYKGRILLVYTDTISCENIERNALRAEKYINSLKCLEK